MRQFGMSANRMSLGGLAVAIGMLVDEACTAVSERVDLPPGYFVEWGGQFENQQRAAARFAMIGGVFALLLTGEYLSVPASVGFIALLGIAVLNGVVMVSYFNQLWERGLSLDELVIEGAKRRLRPVLMTGSIAA